MNILLCCSAGMSTSLLVTKMEKAAQEEGMDAKIWAIPASEVRNHLDEANVILLGPQVRFLLNEMKKIGEEKGIPVDTINQLHYGTMQWQGSSESGKGISSEVIDYFISRCEYAKRRAIPTILSVNSAQWKCS